MTNDMNPRASAKSMFEVAYNTTAQVQYDRIWDPINHQLVENTDLSFSDRVKATNAIARDVIRDHLDSDAVWNRVPIEMREYLCYITSDDARPCSEILYENLVDLS